MSALATVATTANTRPLGGRTVLFGLDSVDLRLLQNWTAQGHLPFFSKLLAECPLVRLTALSRVLQGAIWPSMMTGLSPGHHGHSSFGQLRLGTYNIEQERADLISGQRFYVPLGEHGVRCAVVDVPTDLPHANFNGVQVVDWGSEFQYWDFETRPAELRDEIERRFGKHLFTDYGKTGESLEAQRKLRDDLFAATRLKAAFTRELLSRDDLDLILVVFGEPHKAGHFFWKYMDSSHPDHVPTEPALRDALLHQYELLDAELETLAGLLTPEDNLIVFTDHGMQANYRAEHMVEELLLRLGLSKTKRQARLAGAGATSSTTAERIGRRLRRALHNCVRAVAPPAAVARIRERFGSSAWVDWDNTRAFALPTDRNTYLRVNLQGREPQGCVAPGAEYEALLTYIETEFRALVNGETGRPAVEEVFHVQQLYPGPRAAELPDVAILWSSESPINVLESPAIGRLERRIVEQRSGNHRPEGFMLARGPAFRTGPADIQGDCLQFAPTLLAMHRVPIPDSYVMGPLAEVLA
jgi:predicted AlkP superfamily phosphohydrolase/phosphomutase